MALGLEENVATQISEVTSSIQSEQRSRKALTFLTEMREKLLHQKQKLT